MWNDTDIPLAYLITFRTYGTWQHGDERGSVDREHNRYKSPYASSNHNRKQHNRTIRLLITCSTDKAMSCLSLSELMARPLPQAVLTVFW